MLIGVPREIKNREYRAGLVPACVRELVARGHRVLVESGAGAGMGAAFFFSFLVLLPRPLPSPLKPPAGFSPARTPLRRWRAAVAVGSLESAGTGISSKGAFFMSKS